MAAAGVIATAVNKCSSGIYGYWKEIALGGAMVLGFMSNLQLEKKNRELEKQVMAMYEDLKARGLVIEIED